MKVGGRRVLMCSCEGSMPLDAKALAKALATDPPERVYSQLCRAQVAAYGEALAGGEPLLVCCGQEAPLFGELAGQAGFGAPLCVEHLLPMIAYLTPHCVPPLVHEPAHNRRTPP